MKYIKLLLNIGAAVELALLTWLFAYFLAYLIYRFPTSFTSCGAGGCPTLIWFIGIWVVFPYLIYKFGKYLYKNFFVEQSFYKHIIIVVIPVVMFELTVIWRELDIQYLAD